MQSGIRRGDKQNYLSFIFVLLDVGAIIGAENELNLRRRHRFIAVKRCVYGFGILVAFEESRKASYSKREQVFVRMFYI